MCSARMRATTSVEPPAANGTMNVTGFSGNAEAGESAAASAVTAMAAILPKDFIV